jgi:hypothetical protein
MRHISTSRYDEHDNFDRGRAFDKMPGTLNRSIIEPGAFLGREYAALPFSFGLLDVSRF